VVILQTGLGIFQSRVLRTSLNTKTWNFFPILILDFFKSKIYRVSFFWTPNFSFHAAKLLYTRSFMDRTILERLVKEQGLSEGGLKRPKHDAAAARSTGSLVSLETKATTSSPSQWQYCVMECISPMTTRPHFGASDATTSISPLGIKITGIGIPPLPSRLRSQSLGSHSALRVESQSLIRQSDPAYVSYGSNGTKSAIIQALEQPMMESNVIATDGSVEAVTLTDFDPPSPLCTSAAAPSDNGAGILLHVLYGLINATMVLPITMSFGSIIYRDDAFVPYRPVLVKLVIASGVVHQLCFTTFSTLPFCVGQVQDAGLIFLSVMASNIVSYCRAQNSDEATLLANVTVGLSVATALLGCGLLLVGHWRWAQYMQLLPTWYVEPRVWVTA
jgi:hypothetical protein